MRYSVHPSRAFRNRIAKSIGVLVAAALIATLGLPRAAQAQTMTDVTYADGPGFTVTWEAGRLSTGDITAWIVTFTNPGGTKVAVNQETVSTMEVVLDENDLGTWWIQVGACFGTLEGDDNDECPTGELEEGPSVGYTHGVFPAPENLSASLVPAGVYLSWTSVDSDHGHAGYQYSTDGEDWDEAGDGTQIVEDAMPGEHTFWVRAQGESDNDLTTAEGMAGDAESNGMAASVEITVPMPTPTLPEIALLLLAMLLLGSGAYLLRRRQSGGLTPA